MSGSSTDRGPAVARAVRGKRRSAPDGRRRITEPLEGTEEVGVKEDRGLKPSPRSMDLTWQ